MIIYFVFILIIFILACFAEKYKNSKDILKILLGIIVLLISLFAGVRDENVGTDIRVYVKPLLELMPVYGAVTIYKTAGVELLYVVIVWLAHIINGNLSTLLFLLQLVPSIIFAFFVYKERENISVSLAILAYVTIFMGTSFNIMRQSLAIAISMYSYIYIKERNFKKFIIISIIGMLFHKTAAIFVPVYFLYGLKNTRKGVFIKFCIIAITLIALLMFDNLFAFGIQIGILPEKYNYYLNEFYRNEMDFQVRAVFIKMVFYVISFYYLTQKVFDKDESEFFKLLLSLDFMIFLLGTKILYAERVTYYFSFLIYLYVIPKGVLYEKDKYLHYVINIATYLLYFSMMYIILGFSSIVPYTSSFLGI